MIRWKVKDCLLCKEHDENYNKYMLMNNIYKHIYGSDNQQILNMLNNIKKCVFHSKFYTNLNDVKNISISCKDNRFIIKYEYNSNEYIIRVNYINKVMRFLVNGELIYVIKDFNEFKYMLLDILNEINNDLLQEIDNCFNKDDTMNIDDDNNNN